MLDEEDLEIAKYPLRCDYLRLSLPTITDNRFSLHIFIVITCTVVEFSQKRLRLHLLSCCLRSGVGTIVIGLFLDVLEGIVFHIGMQVGSLDEGYKGLQFIF